MPAKLVLRKGLSDLAGVLDGEGIHRYQLTCALAAIEQSSSVDRLQNKQVGLELTVLLVETRGGWLQLGQYACGNIFLDSAEAIWLVIV